MQGFLEGCSGLSLKWRKVAVVCSVVAQGLETALPPQTLRAYKTPMLPLAATTSRKMFLSELKSGGKHGSILELYMNAPPTCSQL